MSEDRKSSKRKYFDFLIPFFGFLFCFIIIVLPELVVISAENEDVVWSPINSVRFRIGDNYYYAAYMAEVLEGDIPPINPSAYEKQDVPSVEFFKIVPMILSAWPGIITRDNRYVFLISYAFFPSLLFFLCYLFSRRFLESRLVALALGIFIVFFFSELHIFLFSDQFFLSLQSAIYSFFSILEITPTKYDRINDNFRFINISVSSSLVMIYLLLIERYQKSEKFIWIVATVLAGICLAFSYLPQALFGYLFLTVFFIASWIMKQNDKKKHFIALIGIFFVLLVINYAGMVQEYSQNTNFLEDIFLTRSQELSWPPMFKLMVIFKIILVTAFAVFLSWPDRRLREWIIIFGITLIIISGVATIISNPNSSTRFIGRAMSQPWQLLIGIAFFSRLNSLTKYVRYIRPNLKTKFTPAIGGIMTVFFIFLVAKGFIGVAYANKGNDALYIEKNRWDAYQWLNANTEKDSVVLAIDWEDVYLLPIYTKNNLYFGHYIIDNRSSEEEVERYLASWHLLGLQENTLRNYVTNSLENFIRVYEYSRPPYAEQEISESGLFVHGLIYYPYLKYIYGVPLCKDKNCIKTNPEFLNIIMTKYNKIDWKEYFKLYRCDYILISEFYNDKVLNLTGIVNTPPVFQQGGFKILKVDSNSTK